MFEKFDDIRKASAEKYANSGTGQVVTMNHAVDKEKLDSMLDRRRKVVNLISALSKDDQAELTGIILFGRDRIVEKGFAQTLLNQTIRDHAYMVNDKGHSGYLAGKPIHEYLARAEEKLNGDLVA